jgi:hypothetical protein
MSKSEMIQLEFNNLRKLANELRPCGHSFLKQSWDRKGGVFRMSVAQQVVTNIRATCADIREKMNVLRAERKLI